MREADRTTRRRTRSTRPSSTVSHGSTVRQRIADRLREEPATASALGEAFAIPADVAIDHVRHLAQSLPDGAVVVAPPACEDCGFDAFDDPANLPSRCPECHCERVTEPEFAIEE